MSIPFLESFRAKQAARGKAVPALPLFDTLAPVAAEVAPPAPVRAVVLPVATSRADYSETPAAPRIDPAVRAREYAAAAIGAAECPDTARRIWEELAALAVDVLRARAYEGLPSVVEFFAPAEYLIDLLGIHKTTFYRNLVPLVAAGWVDHRAHYGNTYGTRSKPGQKGQEAGSSEARADGTCWAVRLIPGTSAARVTASFLRLEHRNLSYDKKTGKTVYNVLKELCATVKDKSLKADKVRAELRRLALPPVFSDSPPLHMTVAPGLDGIWEGLQLPHVPLSERGAVVDALARLVALLLGDTVNKMGGCNLNLYRRTFWRFLNLADQGTDPDNTLLHAYLNMIQRTVHDMREQFARRGGALLTSRMKASGIWTTLNELAPARVGVRPVAV